MKRVIIITMGLTRIVEPIVSSGVCDVVGLIECAPRIKQKKHIINILTSFMTFHKSLTLKQYADNRKIPYFYMEKSNEKLKSFVSALTPDLMVVYSMSQLLKEEVFSIPRLGTINLHAALLPKYRGPNPDFWMYYNMDLIKGVTVHYIDKGEDTGDILLQDSFEIPLGMTSPEVNDIAIGKIGVNLLLNAIQNIENLPRKKQPENSPLPRARNIKISEHRTIIDWDNWSVEHVWHVLRGTELWLNAFPQPHDLFHLGTRWKIGEYKKTITNLTLGKVYHNKFGIKYLVPCKDGLIVLHKCFSPRTTLIWLFRKLKLLG